MTFGLGQAKYRSCKDIKGKKLSENVWSARTELRHDKNLSLTDVRLIQTGLYGHRRWLKARNFSFGK